MFCLFSQDNGNRRDCTSAKLRTRISPYFLSNVFSKNGELLDRRSDILIQAMNQPIGPKTFLMTVYSRPSIIRFHSSLITAILSILPLLNPFPDHNASIRKGSTGSESTVSAPVSVLEILSRQTRRDLLDCPECKGRGERLIFDPETGSDYCACDACQGTGYNLLGLLVHGLLRPPESGYGPQELKAALKRQTGLSLLKSQQPETSPRKTGYKPACSRQTTPTQTTLELQYGH